MGSLDFLDYMLNICRTPSDVLHILFYLGIAISIILYGWKKSDEESYIKYVHTPVKNKLLRLNANIKFYLYLASVTFHRYRQNSVNVKSNRKLYRGRRRLDRDK